MPLINNKNSQRKEKIKVEINAETLAQINAYCQWAYIDDIGFFIEEAAHVIFAKDKDFKAHQKAIKKQAIQNEAVDS